MGLLFFDNTKDGHGLTLNSKLDPLEIQRGIKLEEHVQVYDDYLKTTGDGTYGYMGEFVKGTRMTVPKAALQEGRSERVRVRMQNGEPPLLMAYEPETGTKLFYEEDQEAYEAGWICPNCVQYQSVPNAPKCTWSRKPEDGCGHVNNIITNL